MRKTEYINIGDYLDHKGIGYLVKNGELVTGCLFGGCDQDSRDNEKHLYFNPDTSQYHCKKCGAAGNIVTLAKHFGDTVSKVMANPMVRQPVKFGQALVDFCRDNLPPRIRKYLNGRGISDSLISQYKLGFGYFKKGHWITIPVFSSDGQPMYFKLRRDPEEGNDKLTWPGGDMQLYNRQVLSGGPDRLLITEGELDCILASSKGLSAVTSTHGAMSFKTEWLDKVRKDLPLYLCFDNDTTGHKAAKKHAQALFKAGFTAVNIITLPDEVGEKGDLTDYFTDFKGRLEDLFGVYAEPYPLQIDAGCFSEMGFEDIARVLDLTIVDDDINKSIVFLAMLSAYTPDSQLNISFNAPSSSGKTYITQEVAKLFPVENVMKLSKCTANAFYHDVGEYVEEENTHVINFDDMVLIFLDQPNQDLMSRMRPLLSHDDRELISKITDKSEKHGLRSKYVKFVGWPVVIYCTTGQTIDDQEATRFILLSPEVNDGRLHRSVEMTMNRHSDPSAFTASVESDPSRILLKKRIQAIQQEDIQKIKIPESMLSGIYDRFTVGRRIKPKDNRDMARLLSFAKIFALLNLWFREREGQNLIVSEDDLNEAFKIWGRIADSQDLSVAPYVLDIFNNVIAPLYKSKNEESDSQEPVGLSRQEICAEYNRVYGHHLSETKLRQDILPPSEEAGLIYQLADPNNNRKKLVIVPKLEL